MKFIDNHGITDPRINLAIEEYALKQSPDRDDYLLFYINEPSIIIGKNQNTIEEINADYVNEHHIHVVRRLSGGGAVYHDRKFTEPVVQALKQLGVEADLTGRNDIQVGERKISGNAQYSTKGRMFSHGTLLFDSEMENIVSALKVNAEKIQSKGIKSIRSRVANITEFLDRKMTIEEFRQAILHSIFGGSEVEEYKLTEEDWTNIHELSKSRYQSWDWNYGKSPKSNYRSSKRFDHIGTVEVQLDIEKGRIKEAKIYGDFFGVRDVAELEEKLQNTPYDRSTVTAKLFDVNLQEFFGNLDRESFVALLIV
jgi:lipoate-protein ligase A